MKSFLALIPILLLSCAPPPSAQIPIVSVRPSPQVQIALERSTPHQVLTISPESLPEAVKKNNLMLASARQLIAEARGQVLRSGLQANPEVEVGFETSQRFEDFMLTVGISRRFPRTNRLILEKRASQILVDAADAEIRNVARVLIGEARLALVKVLALRQRKDLLKRQITVTQELTTFLESAATVGEASILDAGMAELETTKISNSLRQVEVQEVLALAELKPLVGVAPKGKLIVLGSLAPPTLPPRKVSTYFRPDLEAARLQARSAAAGAEVVAAERLDDFEAGIYAGLGRERDEPSGFEAEQILGFRLKFPLGENPAVLGRSIEARARHRRLSLKADALRRIIDAEAHAAYAEMEQWHALAQQIQERLIPIADAQVKRTEEARLQGQATVRDTLLAKDQKLELETTYLEAVRDFHLASAKYQTAIAQ